ncbi:hypothetical protein MYAER_0144 [Microcystis aeruginosa NIES-2549]|uniref:Uncharacterized protein n=1 Tax=Microcystis aeruginosa NIES-2549 TaxID=1641812 RepID=A0A0F6RJC1_MICAE|nr:hypothetical protein MYAER_0144 [Microcystis aeruginosa NIES-2549]
MVNSFGRRYLKTIIRYRFLPIGSNFLFAALFNLSLTDRD